MRVRERERREKQSTVVKERARRESNIREREWALGICPWERGIITIVPLRGPFSEDMLLFFFKICPLRYSLAELESELQYMGDVRKFKKKKIRSWLKFSLELAIDLSFVCLQGSTSFLFWIRNSCLRELSLSS